MPLSNVDIRVLRKMRESDLVQFALEADRESRRLRKLGDTAGAQRWDEESSRLCAVYRGDA